MNRGVARRPVFEQRADTRFFLAQIASILSCSISSAHRRHSAHLESVRLDDRYAEIAARTLARALGQMFSPAPILGMPTRGSSEEGHRNPADLPPTAEKSHLTP